MRTFYVAISVITFSLITFAVKSMGQTPGLFYHTNMHTARYYYWYPQNENLDSAFFYYDLAKSKGIFYKYHHTTFIRMAIRTGRIDKAKEYILEGAKHGFTWKDVISLSKNNNIVKKSEFQQSAIQTTKPKNKWALKILKQAERIDQRSSRKNKTEKDLERLNKNDMKTYQLISSVIDSLGYIPTVSEVGHDGHDILSLVFIHMDAERLIHFLPYLAEAVNEGNYFLNDELAYSIELNAIAEGKYILYKDGKYEILMDSIHKVDLKYHYSYLGELYWPNKLDTLSSRKKFLVANFNPLISIEEINSMRKKLCLETLDIFLERMQIDIATDEELIKYFDIYFPEN